MDEDPPTPADPAAPPGSLRHRLIACAIAILEESGLEALSLRAAARSAGVSHMAPYRHFADKDALLAAVAEEGFLDLGRDMAEVAAAIAQPNKQLKGIGQAYVAFALRRPALYRLMFGPASVSPAGHAALAAAADAAFSRCAEAVAAAAPTDRQGDGPDWALTIATWSLVHGLACLLIDNRIPLPDDPGARQRLIDAVLEVHGAAFAPSPPRCAAFDARTVSP